MKVVGLLFVASLGFGAAPTLIEQRVAASRQAIEKNSKDANAYNDLALALVRRARETADFAFCTQAEAAVTSSLKIAPTAFEGRRARVAVRVCQMRWADALEEATALHKQVMDDVLTWGYIADAQTALGNYDEAAAAVQWMVNMRQASPQALQRGARLREAYGFNEPALDWWNSALRLTSDTDVEERAWLLTRIARLNRMMGRMDAAEDCTKQALSLIPDYPWALTERGLNLTASKKYPEAIDALETRQRVAPGAANLYNLALAYQAAGQPGDAQRTFLTFEKQALELIGDRNNANLQLIAYYAGAGNKPADAVRIAQASLTRQHDIETLEACAEALAAQSNWPAAAEEMRLALKTGVKNPAWLMEAGRIARKTGDTSAARKYFQQALEAAPSSSVSEQIIQELVKTGS